MRQRKILGHHQSQGEARQQLANRKGPGGGTWWSVARQRGVGKDGDGHLTRSITREAPQYSIDKNLLSAAEREAAAREGQDDSATPK